MSLSLVQEPGLREGFYVASPSRGRNPIRCVGAGHSETGSRAGLASQRAAIAAKQLRQCHWCAHRCGVDRLAGQRGPCHAGPVGRIFSAQIEVGDESDLCPVFAVAFSGCDLRCDFCNTGRESWDASAGSVPEGIEREALLSRIGRAWESGAVRSLMILGGEPTIHLASALELVAALPDGLPVVWKTNAHGTSVSNALLDGVFDSWVADLKFGNDDCARRIARVEGYCSTVQDNLLWAAGQTRLIWTGPQDPKRKHLILRTSSDDGKSFSAAKTISEDRAAYSDLAVLKDNTLGIIWERGIDKSYQFITFTRVNEAWLSAEK